MIKLLMMMFLTTNLWAATATWVREPDLYNAYEVTSPKTGKKSIVRVKVANVPDGVQPDWVKQEGQFYREVTAKGATRFVLAPVKDECVAQFTCSTKWGYIVNIRDIDILKCPALKVTKQQIVQYDNATIDKNCPTYLK